EPVAGGGGRRAERTPERALHTGLPGRAAGVLRRGSGPGEGGAVSRQPARAASHTSTSRPAGGRARTSMAPRERRTSLIVRWGWLAMTIALVIALLANAVGNRRAARDAVATLNRGQADILRGAVRIATFRNRDLTAEELEALVAEHADQGLRYLAVIDDEGRVLMSAGTPAGGVVPRLRRFGPDVLDARAGAMQFAMPLGRPGGREPRLIVVQFEPVVASRLVARADRSVALALIGAASS